MVSLFNASKYIDVHILDNLSQTVQEIAVTSPEETDYVIIDNQGLKTYAAGDSGGNWQCFVGSNGKMQAGSGNVTLGQDGIAIYPNDESNFASYLNLVHSKGSVPLSMNETGSYPKLWFGSVTRGGGPDRKFQTTFAMGDVYFDSDIHVGANSFISALSSWSLPNKNAGTCFTWYITLGESNTTTNEAFVICGGYATSSSATNTVVSFPVTFTHIYGGSCTTNRPDSSGKGNDYVSSITTSSMNCKHDAGSGFSWMAWGIVVLGTKKYKPATS